ARGRTHQHALHPARSCPKHTTIWLYVKGDVLPARQHPVEIVDRLLGVDDLDRLHPHRRRRLEVDAEVVEEQALAWVDAEQLAGHRVEHSVALFYAAPAASDT